MRVKRPPFDRLMQDNKEGNKRTRNLKGNPKNQHPLLEIGPSKNTYTSTPKLSRINTNNLENLQFETPLINLLLIKLTA